MSSEIFVIENCILSYPHFFALDNNGKYSASLLVTAETARKIWDKAQMFIPTKFTKDEAALPHFKICGTTPCATHPKYGTNPRLAALYIVNTNAFADSPVQVVDSNRAPIVDRGQIYAGCIVAAGIKLYGYNAMGKIGVGANLSAVMKTGEGESLGDGGVDPNALFTGVAANPTAPGATMPGGAPGTNAVGANQATSGTGPVATFPPFAPPPFLTPK